MTISVFRRSSSDLSHVFTAAKVKTKKKNGLNINSYKCNGYLQKTYQLDKSKQLQAPCSTKTKANGKCVKALQAQCTLWLPWKTKIQQIYGPMCFINI